MHRCIFCKNTFTKAKTEHFIQKSLGGWRKSSVIICTKCNETYGNSIDNELSQSLDWIKCLLDIKRPDSKPAPSIKGVDLGVDRSVNVKSDGSLEADNTDFGSGVKSDDGKCLIVDIKLNEIGELKEKYRYIAAKYKISPQKLVEGLRKSKFTAHTIYPKKDVKMSLSLGEKTHLRSWQKVVLNI